jgi:3',5'-cyclic AMP phosphodiesterase CpdA
MNETLRASRRASGKSRAALKPAIERIVCISDTHGPHRKVAVHEGDLLIHAGDFMRTGMSLEEIADFNDWLGEQPHPHKIVVAGNHDLLFEMAPDSARRQLTNAVYLENDKKSGIGRNELCERSLQASYSACHSKDFVAPLESGHALSDLFDNAGHIEAQEGWTAVLHERLGRLVFLCPTD